MSNYVKLTDYASKDALSTGNPLKLIKGTEINDDLNAIQTAVATKADLSSPDFLGNPTAPLQVTGNNTTRLANTAFVQQELAAAQADVDITGGTIDGVAITGGTVSGLATDLAVADGGTGVSTLTLNSVILGNGIDAVQTVAPGAVDNILTSNGTTWESAAPPVGITPTSGDAPYFGARAWCSFSGTTTGTFTPPASGNVTSVTRNSSGNYTVNFTTAMPDANYSAQVLCQGDGSSYGYFAVISASGRTTTSFTFSTLAVTAGAGSPAVVCVSIIR